jgi:hypothetical protein
MKIGEFRKTVSNTTGLMPFLYKSITATGINNGILLTATLIIRNDPYGTSTSH